VPGGMFIHSGVGLLPHAYVLAIEAVAVLAGWLATRNRTRNAERVARLLAVVVVGYALVMSVAGTAIAHRGWADRMARMETAVEALDSAGVTRDERVMSIDAAGYLYLSGRPGVVIVDDPIETVEEVARAYDIRWIIVEPEASTPSLAGVDLGTNRPAWIGPPVLSRPDVSVYPVCAGADLARCEG
jgi:hypothetical protein